MEEKINEQVNQCTDDFSNDFKILSKIPEWRNLIIWAHE